MAFFFFKRTEPWHHINVCDLICIIFPHWLQWRTLLWSEVTPELKRQSDKGVSYFVQYFFAGDDAAALKPHAALDKGKLIILDCTGCRRKEDFTLCFEPLAEKTTGYLYFQALPPFSLAPKVVLICFQARRTLKPSCFTNQPRNLVRCDGWFGGGDRRSKGGKRCVSQEYFSVNTTKHLIRPCRLCWTNLTRLWSVNDSTGNLVINYYEPSIF